MDIESSSKLLYDSINYSLEDLSSPKLSCMEAIMVVVSTDSKMDRWDKTVAEGHAFFDENKGGWPICMEKERQEVIRDGQQATYHKGIRFCLY